MKRILTALALLCGLPMMAADSTIGNLTPITTVPDTYVMPWENPAVQDYKIAFSDLTNQVLTGYASQAYAVAAASAATNGYAWTNIVPQQAVHATNADSATGATWATNYSGTIPIANVTTPGQILTNGNSTAVTISNTITATGSISTSATLGTTGSGAINSASSVACASASFFQGQKLYPNASSAGLTVIGGGATVGGEIYFGSGSGTDYKGGLQFYTGAGASSKLAAQMDTNQSLSMVGTITATNGLILQCKPSFFTNFTCTTNLQVYFCNGTNQWITLPNAANVPGVVYRICTTNGWAKVIITNATGTQTVRDGTSLSHTQIGVGNPSFISDGAAWWPASKIRTIFPNAQFSCTTNIPLTAASTSYPVTFDSTDFNNSQGIALLPGTNGLNSMIWITNSGQYEFTPSIVINFGGNNTVTTWFKKDGVNIVNSATAIKGAAGGSIRCVTIPFVVSVTTPAAYEIWCQSTSTGDSLSFQAAGGAAPNDYPLSPSVICPVKRISDTWP